MARHSSTQTEQQQKQQQQQQQQHFLPPAYQAYSPTQQQPMIPPFCFFPPLTPVATPSYAQPAPLIHSVSYAQPYIYPSFMFPSTVFGTPVDPLFPPHPQHPPLSPPPLTPPATPPVRRRSGPPTTPPMHVKHPIPSIEEQSLPCIDREGDFPTLQESIDMVKKKSAATNAEKELFQDASANNPMYTLSPELKGSPLSYQQTDTTSDKQERLRKSGDDEGRVLWIGNICSTVTQELLESAFSPHGHVEAVKIIHHKHCAFITYRDPKSALTALETMYGKNLGGQTISVHYRKRQQHFQEPENIEPKSPSKQESQRSSGSFLTGSTHLLDQVPNPPSRALWIGNVSDALSESEFIRVVTQYGEVESIKLLRNKMCAFVNYYSQEEAEAALSSLQGMQLGGLPIKVNYGKPQPPPRRDSFPSPPTFPSSLTWNQPQPQPFRLTYPLSTAPYSYSNIIPGGEQVLYFAPPYSQEMNSSWIPYLKDNDSQEFL